MTLLLKFINNPFFIWSSEFCNYGEMFVSINIWIFCTTYLVQFWTLWQKQQRMNTQL